jgi:hypothetical protein
MPRSHSQEHGIVHKEYWGLVEQRETTWQDREQFFAMAAQCMGRILLDHARACHAEKSGGSPERLPHEELINLDQMLDRLAELSLW